MPRKIINFECLPTVTFSIFETWNMVIIIPPRKELGDGFLIAAVKIDTIPVA